MEFTFEGSSAMSGGTRMAWLSPYGPASDIGAFTRCLLPHFDRDDPAGRFECDLFINSNGETYDSPVPAMNIPDGAGIGEILGRYDAAVFNLGNNVVNHAHVAAALRRIPGIAVLHDFSYHHFFAHKCFEELHAPPAYARFMREYYGSAGFNMALRSGVITRDATLYAPWDGENVSEYPLMQPLAALASAVVVHSRFMEEHVAKFFKGPILRLFLPSDQKARPNAADLARWRTETAGRDRCQFTSFGHIGRSKCIDVVIQAIASSPVLRARSQFVIAGHPGDREYVREIESMVAKLGLSRQVIFEYSVTNERLLAIKNDTDIFLNLRFPNTEGASGSLVEMMNAGRPVIAYRSGCYADTPQDAAVLIEKADGVEAVAAAMEDLLSNSAKRVALGEAARNFVSGQDSRQYVRAFKQFVLDIAPQLKRRSRFITPVRNAMTWSATDVDSADAEWFAELTRARRSLDLLDRDGGAQSPEIFLTWPMDDLVAFTGRVLLHAVTQTGFSALLAGYAQRLGRWPFYRMIEKLCFYQAFCLKPEVPKADFPVHAERVGDVAFWDIATHLQPEIIVRMFYACILERFSPPAEQENWIRRLRQGALPAAILLDFLSSAEYRQTFSDGLMADVEDWARKETLLASDRRPQKRPQTVWPVDAPVRFNEDNPTTKALLGQLWHRRDAQGRWSDGRTGDLRFHLPDGAAENGVTLALRVRVAGTSVTGPRRVLAQVDRREIGSITLMNDIPQNWVLSLPASLHSKDGLSLFLIADQDYSPASSGQSADKRALGVMLMEGHLSVDAPKKGESLAEPQLEPDG
jgi:glycosyltransferase involved in cell wall biosynthesis